MKTKNKKESKKVIGLIVVLLVVLSFIIFLFWNFEPKLKKTNNNFEPKLKEVDNSFEAKWKAGDNFEYLIVKKADKEHTDLSLFDFVVYGDDGKIVGEQKDIPIIYLQKIYKTNDKTVDLMKKNDIVDFRNLDKKNKIEVKFSKDVKDIKELEKMFGGGAQKPPKVTIDESIKNLKEGKKYKTKSGLEFEVLKLGKGDKPKATDTVVVDYVGTLLNGFEFDSSAKHGGKATFSLQRVIRGWTEGMQYMPVGSKFKFTIPANLGYGSMATEEIPANSTLIFVVDLYEIK